MGNFDKLGVTESKQDGTCRGNLSLALFSMTTDSSFIIRLLEHDNEKTQKGAISRLHLWSSICLCLMGKLCNKLKEYFLCSCKHFDNLTRYYYLHNNKIVKALNDFVRKTTIIVPIGSSFIYRPYGLKLCTSK